MIGGLYQAVVSVGGPAIQLYLNRRLRAGKEDPERFTERLGQASLPRPHGRLLWIHAASVGESLSVLPLLERLLAARPDWHALITTGTVTSARLMADRLPARAVHQYVPVDRPAWVRRFLDHWRPDAALWMESELWPALVLETARRGVPMALLNGRMSARSFRRWSHFGGFARQLLGSFTLTFGQSEEDSARLAALGAHTAPCPGNLKSAAPPLPVDDDALDTLRAVIGNRPLWLAASTHAGEEALAWRVHQRLAAHHPGLLTIIVPRHPPRGDGVAAELLSLGARVAQRSKGTLPDVETTIYLADTMGETGLFYRLSRLVLIGKSLIGQGGQNPLEPARLGAVVLFGPHMDNFVAMADRLLQARAAHRVYDENTLTETLDHLLSDPETIAAMGAAGAACAAVEDAVLDRLETALLPLLDGKGKGSVHASS